MDDQVPATQAVKAAYVQAHWDEVIDAVRRQGTRVLVQQDGAAVAAIVSADDLRRLNQLDQRRRERPAMVDNSQSGLDDHVGGDAVRKRESVGSPESTSNTRTIDPEVLFAPPSAAEIERRRAVVAEVLANRSQRVITPLTAADLVHRARDQEQRSYGKPR